MLFVSRSCFNEFLSLLDVAWVNKVLLLLSLLLLMHYIYNSCSNSVIFPHVNHVDNNTIACSRCKAVYFRSPSMLDLVSFLLREKVWYMITNRRSWASFVVHLNTAKYYHR